MDFVDVTSRLNVVSLPSLFGLDPAEIEDEGMGPTSILTLPLLTFLYLENVETLEAKSLAKNALSSDLQQAGLKSVTYTDFDDPFSLMDNMFSAPNIFRISHNAWVGCGDNIYVLACLQYGDIRIQPTQDDNGTSFICFVYGVSHIDAVISRRD